MDKSRDTLDEEAVRLVKLNQSEVRTIMRSYVFPDPSGQTIRVVHVDTMFFPEDSVHPIEFGPDPQYKIYHRHYIGFTDPDGPQRLSPPEGWGSWQSAQVIDRPIRRKAG